MIISGLLPFMLTFNVTGPTLQKNFVASLIKKKKEILLRRSYNPEVRRSYVCP